MAQTITGTFPEGIIVGGKVCRQFTLVEQTFRTTLEVAHDPAIDANQLDDQVYYSACLMAKRLKIEGIDHVTPDMILDLSALDAAELIGCTTSLETQRANFRNAAQAAAQEGPGTAQAGLSEA